MLPRERLIMYDVGSSTDRQEIIIQNRISHEEFSKSSLQLNSEQRQFYFEVVYRTKSTSDLYYIFLFGGAGVGKFHLLKTLDISQIL